MSGLRRVLFWAHLATGVSAGLVILVMAVTGALLAFEVQITAWADREYRVVPPAGDAPARSIEALLRAVQDLEPAVAVSGVTLAADPQAPVAITLGRERTLLVDPYSARVLGESAPHARAFFLKVTDWHRFLAMGGENRPTGKAITAACNLGFFFLVCSGFYLWWPREWSPKRLTAVVLFQRGLSGRARDFNWHNVIGLWSALPLALIVGSSVVISYPWAGDLVYQAVGEKPPARRAPGGPAGSERASSPRPLDVAGLDAVVAQAERQVEGWQTVSLRLPATPDGRVTVTIARAGRGRPDLKGQLTLDKASAAVVTWEPFESYSRGRQLRTWLRWVHTGEAGGAPGQALAALASSGAAVLVWTGLALGLRRFSAWRVRRTAAPRGLPVQQISLSSERGKS